MMEVPCAEPFYSPAYFERVLPDWPGVSNNLEMREAVANECNLKLVGHVVIPVDLWRRLCLLEKEVREQQEAIEKQIDDVIESHKDFQKRIDGLKL